MADYLFYLLYLVQKYQYSKSGRGEEQVCGRLLVLLALLRTKVPVHEQVWATLLVLLALIEHK